MVTLRPYQERAVADIREAFGEFRRVLFVLPTGGGKCLARGTPVLMFDGTIKPVEDVQVDDLLMGPDSQPRRVLSLARGTDQMYRVTPKKGDAYVVNSAHILSLKMTAGNKIGFDAGAIVNLTVTDYLSRTKTFRHCAKGWRIGVEFPAHSEPLAVEPYFLGLWLGDGNARKPCITTGDAEIAVYLAEHAQRLGMALRVEPNSPNSLNYHTVEELPEDRLGRGANAVSRALRQYGLIQNKHIPHRYKTGTRQERLEVLAGLLDADGHLHHNFYEISAKCPRLADDILFLARSLGLAAYVLVGSKTCGNNGVSGEYSRISISGHVDMIPCRIARKKATPRGQVKDALVHGLTVEPAGEGEYFGFELDGDRLFLLGDFTVTHNTVVFSHIAEQACAKGKRVVIVAHRRRIVNQISAALRRMDVAHGLIVPGATLTDDPVQVGMIQTIARRLGKLDEPDLLVIDEAHHGVAGTWERVASAWKRCRQLGVSATPERLDGKGLRPAFDEMVLGPYPRDLIARGALSDYEYLAPPNKLDLTGVKTRGGDYALDQLAEMLTESPITGDAVEHYGKHLNGKPAVVFCVNVMHAQMVAERFRDAGWKAASVDGTMSAAEQEDIITALGDGRLNVLTSCELISEGVDVPNVAGCILLRPTKSLALWLQQVGRALRPNEDGSHSIILDHVGSVHRFGMPCFPRDWSLDGRKKRKPAADVTTCKLCFRTLPVAVARGPGFECGGLDEEVCPFLEERESGARELPEEVEGELQKVIGIAPPGQTRPEWAGGLCLETAQGRNWFDLLDRAGTDPERLEEIRMARKYRHGWVGQMMRTRHAQEVNATEIIECGRLHALGRASIDRLMGIISGDTDNVLWLTRRILNRTLGSGTSPGFLERSGDAMTLSYVEHELKKRRQKKAA